MYLVFCMHVLIQRGGEEELQTPKIVSEYDQEKAQSQTVEKPMASRGRATWLKVSLEILVRNSLEKQLDPWSPIASQGRLVRPSAKYVDNYPL